ncbi:FERM, ARHGEF and pleckstrin domain-containing protein 2-like isoform X2 [Tubulanus polymorphus]|uniref:FERM, ARHGEF and pleckstrin domain-containing protein 2-like isoform X2 n=1 Tax=Tubulanus polymorphus TaxID=672921 RepID=UPI003DA5B3F6
MSHSNPTSPPMSPRKGKYMMVKVLMLDNSVNTFQIPQKATGLVLYEEVLKKLQLLEADYFDLEYIHAEGITCWLDHDKPILKQVGSPNELNFRFSVKFYTPDPGLLEEEYTRYLFALQVKRDLASGAMPCTENTSALLASYIAQAELGDFQDEYTDRQYIQMCKILPPSVMNERVEDKIVEFHAEHVNETPAEADFNLLDTARKVELYGVKMCPAKTQQAPFRPLYMPDHEGVPLHLAVAHMGVLVFQNNTKINTFSWAKVRKLSFKRKKFLIKLHPEGYGYYKDTVEFYFDTRNECKNFWKKCIEHHAFFRCHTVKRLPRNKTRVVSRGSSFRYGGRTQKQLVEYVREHFVKRPGFERSMSARVSNRSDGATTKSSTLNSTDLQHYHSHNSTSSGSHTLDISSRENVLSRVETADVHDDTSQSSRSAGSPRKDSLPPPPEDYRQDYNRTASEDSLPPPPPSPPGEPIDNTDVFHSNKSFAPPPSSKIFDRKMSEPAFSIQEKLKRLEDQKKQLARSPEVENIPQITSMTRKQKLLMPNNAANWREQDGMIRVHSSSDTKRDFMQQRSNSTNTPDGSMESGLSPTPRMNRRDRSSSRDREPSPLCLTPADELDNDTFTYDEDTVPVPMNYRHESPGPIHKPTGPVVKQETSSSSGKVEFYLRDKDRQNHSGQSGHDNSYTSVQSQGTSRTFTSTLSSASGASFKTDDSDDDLMQRKKSVESEDEGRRKRHQIDQAYYIAKELLMTERTYKKDIEVLTVWFRNMLCQNDLLPDYLTKLIFTYIDPIYDHHCWFLKELEQRLAMWEGKSNAHINGDYRKIGDLMVNNTKILQYYREYLDKLDEILTDMDVAVRNSKRLETAYKEFESQKFCYLPLNTFLLKPVHRLLHYYMLMDRLLQHYSADHPDYRDCNLAHQRILDVTDPYRDRFWRLENVQRLLELQRDLSGIDNLIQPHRQFIREGCLQKLSKKGYQQRMFFLFSDMLIYTSRTTQPTLQFKVHGQLPLRGMAVEETDSKMAVANSFTIYGGNRCLLVAAGSLEEKDKWVEDITNAIIAAKERSGDHKYPSLKSQGGSIDELDEPHPPTTPPASEKQVQHRANTTMHVCWHRNTSVSFGDHQLAVKNQLSGYVLRKFKNSNGWQKLWVVFTNFCLFFYKTFQDDYPLASLPLLGYAVSTPCDTDGIHKEYVFKLQFKNHVYFFRAESQYPFERWMEVIGSATNSAKFHRMFSRLGSDN